MPIPDEHKGFDILFDPKYNLYTENIQNISDSKELSIDIGNITFRVIYNAWNFAKYSYKQSSMLSHAHPYFELHIIKNGTREMLFEESSIKLNSNDSLLVSPNTYHCYKEQSEPVEMASISFYISRNKQPAFPDYYSRFESHLNETHGFSLFKNKPNIIDYFSRLSGYSELNTPLFPYFYNILLKLIFAEIVLYICNDIEIQPMNDHALSEHDLRIQTIQYYFIWHYDDNLTLKQLAKAIKLSEKQTGRIIKKYFGADFKTHLSNVRLKNSKKLLKETSMEIRDVAAAVGFQSYNGYYVAFKKAFGLTPMEYRKKHQV